MAKLGEYIEKIHIPFSNHETDEILKPYGVSNVNGIVKTDHVRSSDLSKYLIIKPNYFAYNPYRINVGSIGLTPSNIMGLVSPAYIVFKTKEDLLIPELLLKILKSKHGLFLINKFSRGTVRKALRFDDLCDMDINIPSYNEQDKILKKMVKFDEVNSYISNELTNQRNLRSKLNQSILQDAIQGHLTKDWREENQNIEPASVLLERVKAEKEQLIADKKIKKEKTLPSIKKEEIPFELPDKWVWCRLGAISIYINGRGFRSSDFQKNNGIKCIKITNAGVGKIIPTDDTLPLHFKEKYSDFLVYKNDIVIALTRPYISEGLKVSLCSTEYNESLLNQRVATIKALFNTNKYIYNFLRTNFVLNGYKAEFESKGQQPNLKSEHITNLLLPLPPIDEQIEIVKKIESLMQKCDQLEEEIKKSESNAEMLMQSVLKESLLLA